MHYGQQDLIFYFAGAISEFVIGNLPNGGDGGGGLSNFCAYSVAAVPLPAALPLLGTALLGLLGLGRRTESQAG